jgi:hypothetical protein
LTAYFLGLSPQNTTKNSTKSILPSVLFFISAAVFKQTVLFFRDFTLTAFIREFQKSDRFIRKAKTYELGAA